MGQCIPVEDCLLDLLHRQPNTASMKIGLPRIQKLLTRKSICSRRPLPLMSCSLLPIVIELDDQAGLHGRPISVVDIDYADA